LIISISVENVDIKRELYSKKYINRVSLSLSIGDVILCIITFDVLNKKYYLCQINQI